MTPLPQVPSSWSGADDPPDAASSQIDVARVERALAHGQISESHGVMRWGSNYAALVSVIDGDTALTAVYKPQRGERPLWDFPDGTLCYREVLAYDISQTLGWELVPPTVLREGPHGLGSLQLFIDHDPSINYFSLDDTHLDQLQRFAVFDSVINNADRKAGHLLLDAHGKLWGIDHGLSFHSVPKLRTVIWEFEREPIPPDLLRALEGLLNVLLCHNVLWISAMQRWLNTAEITALIRRIEKLLAERTFPSPSGLGPSYPWPPV